MGSRMGCLLFFPPWLVKYLNEQTEPHLSFLQALWVILFFIFLLIEIDKNENVCKWGFLPNLARFKKMLTSYKVSSPNALYTDSSSHCSLYGAMSQTVEEVGRSPLSLYTIIWCHSPLWSIQIISFWLSCLELKNQEEKKKNHSGKKMSPSESLSMKGTTWYKYHISLNLVT